MLPELQHVFQEARNLEAVFPRGPNLEYKYKQQAKRFSLSHETLPEAHLTLYI